MIKFDNTLPQKSRIRKHNKLTSLPQGVVKQFLKSLDNGWIINANNRLFREYKFVNFLTAMDFANKITLIAEEEKHHPNLYISWGACSVEIWTHTINGLTENDFVLAYQISELIK
jgi:4a-hydroxytetrahydrobiopterin dehydratase